MAKIEANLGNNEMWKKLARAIVRKVPAMGKCTEEQLIEFIKFRAEQIKEGR